MDTYSMNVPQPSGQVRREAQATPPARSSLRFPLGLATAVFATYVALSSSCVSGPQVASIVDNVGLLAFEFVAVATLFVAGRSSVKFRRAWWLLGGAVAGAAIRQAVLSAGELVLHTEAPVQMAGDLASVLGLTLAIGAVL